MSEHIFSPVCCCGRYKEQHPDAQFKEHYNVSSRLLILLLANIAKIKNILSRIMVNLILSLYCFAILKKNLGLCAKI
jgi:hypothetical protein